ncbi:unnamed protein product [Hanseniaspora opuntiae]
MTTDNLNSALSFKHLFSKECLSRGESPIKTTMKYFLDPEFHFLGAGMPPLELFAFQNFGFKSLDLRKYTFNEIQDVILNKNDNFEDYINGNITEDGLDSDVLIERALQYGNSRGHPALLNFLKVHINNTFKPAYKDWDILVNNGSTYGLESLLRIFCNRKDTILLEDLCYSSTIEAIQAQGINTVPIKMDSQGLVVEDLEYKLKNWDTLYGNLQKPKLMYLIPNGHNPKGVTLCDRRKLKIYQLIKDHDMILIEDDPYFWLQMPEYKKPSFKDNQVVDENKPENDINSNQDFLNKLSHSFLSIDTDGRVLRLESFSKYFGPGTRLGYLVGSKEILDNVWNYHEVSLQASSGISQLMVNGLLNRWGQNGYLNWFKRLRVVYTQKRNFCLNSLYKHIQQYNISEYVQVEEAPKAGMFFMIYLNISKHPDYNQKLVELGKEKVVDYFENLFFEKFIESKLLLAKGSWFTVNNPCHSVVDISKCMLRGTYAAVTPEKMDNGLKIFADIVNQEFS